MIREFFPSSSRTIVEAKSYETLTPNVERWRKKNKNNDRVEKIEENKTK